MRANSFWMLSSLLVLCPSVGCKTLHSAYLTNMSVPDGSRRAIDAESSKTVFLGLNFSNDYADEAREQLYAQCPDGLVTGVLSTFETTSYLIVTTHTVKAHAFCVVSGGDERETGARSQAPMREPIAVGSEP